MSKPYALCVVHFFNHQTHHRGQVHAMLTAPGRGPTTPIFPSCPTRFRMAMISPSRRLRRTPFSDGVEAAGVKAYTVYNHMLLPTVFRSVEEDYHHLKNAVQVWDVACERQVEVRGPDAARLVQMLTPRDLRGMLPGQCYYVPMVDETGGMLNDPVAVKLSRGSLVDLHRRQRPAALGQGDGQWLPARRADRRAGCLAAGRAGAEGRRPDGAGLRRKRARIRFFRFGHFDFQGRDLVIARSGYSKQGGFEIYVEGADIGMPLWNALMEAGRDLDVRAGCPNAIERIEGGLLSYGNDMTRENTPHECGLGRFCNTADRHRLYRARRAPARGQGRAGEADPRHRDRNGPCRPATGSGR
jgi:dimethylsulfoniopropionate demethylase